MTLCFWWAAGDVLPLKDAEAATEESSESGFTVELLATALWSGKKAYAASAVLGTVKRSGPRSCSMLIWLFSMASLSLAALPLANRFCASFLPSFLPSACLPVWPEEAAGFWSDEGSALALPEASSTLALPRGEASARA